MKVVRVFVTEDWGFSLETACLFKLTSTVLRWKQYNHVQCYHGFSEVTCGLCFGFL